MTGVSRGVTTPLNYVLILGMVALLVSTLVLGVGGLVDGEQERTVRAQLEVIGHRFANDLTAAEQLGRHGGGAVRLVADLPPEAVGSWYAIEVASVGSGRYELRLRSANPDVTTVVPFRSETTIVSNTVRGGPVVVTYTPTGPGEIEVVASG